MRAVTGSVGECAPSSSIGRERTPPGVGESNGQAILHIIMRHAANRTPRAIDVQVEKIHVEQPRTHTIILARANGRLASITSRGHVSVATEILSHRFP
jgi:hypothetical protein